MPKGRKTVKAYFLTLVSCLALSNVASAAQWKLVAAKTYQFPYGVSVSDPIVLHATSSSEQHVKVGYTGSTECYIQAERIEVQTHQGTLALLPDAQGVFNLPAADITQAVIHARSSKWSKVTCTESLYIETAPSVDQMKYLGSLSIEPQAGEVVFKLTSAAKLTHFQIEVPAFCKAMNIADAATMTEGEWDNAKIVDTTNRIFEVGDGAGIRISAIRLILEDTADMACPINVYGRVKK